MRLLLDTHALYWYVDQDHMLSRVAHAAITNSANDLLLSAATIWEMSIKIGQGRLAVSLPFRQWMLQAVADLSLTILPVTVAYADRQSRLPFHHRDPFDRLMIAQALEEGIAIVSADAVFDQYGVTRLW